jgi:hypothetical protein
MVRIQLSPAGSPVRTGRAVTRAYTQMIARAARCRRGAGRDDRPIAKEQFAEARGRGHVFSLQLSASACRREW